MHYIFTTAEETSIMRLYAAYIVRHKFLIGKILTNLMNLQQFVNMLPVKMFHLGS